MSQIFSRAPCGISKQHILATWLFRYTSTTEHSLLYQTLPYMYVSRLTPSPNISVSQRQNYSGGFCLRRPLSCSHLTLMARFYWGSIGTDNCSLIHNNSQGNTFIDTNRCVMFWEDKTSNAFHNNTPYFSPLIAAAFASTKF